MKRLLVCLLSLALLVACQPTPEQEVVINKADPQMSAAETDPKIAETLAAVPKGWQASFSLRDGTVNVQVDAAIETPDIDRFPIVEVVPAPIDPQIAAQLLYKLIPGGAIRISDHGGGTYSLEDVDRWIEEVKAQLAHTAEMTFDTDAQRDAYIDAQNEELQRLFSLRESAVSGSVTMLKEYELLGRYGAMEHNVTDANAMDCAVFMWKPQSADGQDKRESILHIDSLTPTCGLLDHGVESPEEARTAADKLIREIGLSDRYVCVSVEDRGSNIVCCYGVQYGGIASSPLTETIIDVGSYRAPWPNEALTVCFNKHEGRTSVSLACPSTIAGEIGNANLLPFSEIQAQFEQNMKAAYSWLDEGTLSSAITVDRITLGYYRVPQKDSPDRYMLIPAWTFLGTRTTEEPSDTGSGTYLCENDLPNRVLMILSGLDGSLLYAG